MLFTIETSTKLTKCIHIKNSISLMIIGIVEHSIILRYIHTISRIEYIFSSCLKISINNEKDVYVCSHMIATHMQFSNELLHVSMQTRLYLHLLFLRELPTSSSLELYSISG